jgi:hypothetical protein
MNVRKLFQQVPQYEYLLCSIFIFFSGTVSGINSGADPGTDNVRNSGKDPETRSRIDFRKM